MDTTLHYIGANGNMLDLFDNPYADLVDAEGITENASDIATSTTPSMDGDKINNIVTQPRGIVLSMQIKDDVSVEDAKRYILRSIKPKQKGRLVLHQSGRDIQIAGVVESISMPRFGQDIIMQISLYCNDPYWHDVENVLLEISRVLNMHYFPVDVGGLAFPAEGIPFGEYELNMTRTYTKDGDAECGMIITIIALANVVNPTIYKTDGSFIGVNDNMVVGDEIIINTNRGEKSITKNGTNILSKIKPGSSFLQLDTGDNELTIDSDGDTEGNVYFMLAFKRRFV